jgi:PAS domain S-box-containing protein
MEKTDTLYKLSSNKNLTNATSLAGLPERFEELIQKLPGAFYATDKDGYITFYNDAAVQLWGREPEIGKDMWCGSFKIFDLDGITEVPLDQCPMALTLKRKQSVRVNEPFIVECPDKSRKYFIPYPDPIFDENGNMVGATNMLMDVTESRLAENQKAMLAAIIHSSSDAIISKTLNSIITSWNQAAEKMFGYTAEEMIGQSIFKLIPPDRTGEESEILEKIKKGELVDHYETKRLTKDRKLIDISLTISPIKDSKGNIIGASKIARDITQTKILERHKDDFIKLASHELKTPVTSLSGYVQLLLHISDDRKYKLPDVIKTCLHTVEKQVSKLSDLITELLDVSKIESGRLELFKTQFKLEKLVEECIEEARQITLKHAIIFRSDYQGKITADKLRIGQVITNLLNNAIKYSPASDKVSVFLKKENEHVQIEITDFGIGIDISDQPKIFERFYRVNGREVHNFPGFGIGLFISNEIVNRHDGTIEVKSEKNKGSVFTITLPLTP